MSGHAIGSPLALHQARLRLDAAELALASARRHQPPGAWADEQAALTDLVLKSEEFRFHRAWNAIDRALVTEQLSDRAWAAVARLHEHVRALAGVRDFEGLAPVGGYCTAKLAAELRSPTVRIGDDEFLILHFQEESNPVAVHPNDGGEFVHVGASALVDSASVAPRSEVLP